MPGDVERVLAKALAAAAHLPEVEEGTTYGAPALKVRGKVLCVAKDAGTLYLRCALEDKEMLMTTAPEIYYETDHYKGWPGLLVRIDKITKKELAIRLERAWRIQAPKTLVKSFDAPVTAGKSRPAKRR